MEKHKRKSWIIILIIVLAIAAGAYGMYYAIVEKGLFTTTIVNKSEKEVTVNENGIADAVEKLYDAVVVVGSYKSGVLTSSGTGFVYKVDGNTAYILTNNHVVSGASKVKVKFTNSKVYEVKVVGSDEYSDIAVLSIDKSDIISVASIGSSTNARLGDTLFTIGAPIDSEYSWTVTRGILSGKDRLVEISDSSENSSTSNWVMKVLQTDAAINAGNSGGPLANSNGEVIGITNMKLVSDGVEGMGFAIPIEDAINYANMLIKSGKIERPLLGVGTLNISDTQAMNQYGFSIDKSITEGAVVGYVQKGSPADNAGIEKGDVITKFGDYEIKSSSYLKYYLYKYNVGDKVKITYIRGTETKEATITLNQKAS
jgi:serine protease Do